MSEFIFIGIAHTLFIVIFIGSNKNTTISDNILIAWLIFLAMPLLTRALSPALLDIPLPLIDKKLAYPLCWGPFLWLYVKCVTGDIEKFKVSYLSHFLPFLFTTSFQAVFQEPPGMSEIHKAGELNSSFGQLIWLVNIMSLFCYSSLVIRRLQQHSQEVLKSFSSLTTQITLRWLIWLTCAFIIAYISALNCSFCIIAFTFSVTWLCINGVYFCSEFFWFETN
ncbi:hypothetical protein ACLKMH_10510 [Psychromonas sp. KJ10-10]|uniref:hypothetical protein n=1 Tax=Psychromonas sp. KJ10-10 TaxID=3391823 RepID=UPI0039B54122